MAIKSTVADAVFTFTNTTRVSREVLPDITSISTLTAGIWVKLNNTTPFILWSYEADSDNYIRISHNGTNWIWTWRVGGGSVTTETIHAISPGDWEFIVYTKNANAHKVYYSIDTYPAVAALNLQVNVTAAIAFTFAELIITAGQDNAICNYKCYQTALAAFELVVERDLWLQDTGTFYIPHWLAPLRRAGDLDNHSVLFPDPWASRHEWDSTPDWTTLSFESDPPSLVVASCEAWLYPVGGIPLFSVFINPSTFAGGVFSAPQSYLLEDREAVPLTATVTSMTYGGHFTNVGTPPSNGALSCWGLYNGSGPETSANLIGALPANPLAASIPLTMANIYSYLFGAKFYWDPSINPSSTAYVNDGVLRVVYVGEFTPPPPSGTIQVIKVTAPLGSAVSFDFTAGGGLSPTTFSLLDGESQTFTAVPVGSGYSIVETPNVLFDTAYVVSNDSPIDDITVADGEVVTITVTNTLLSAIGAGIYSIVPSKRDDSIWNANGDSVIVVKIPDPYGVTGFIGD